MRTILLVSALSLSIFPAASASESTDAEGASAKAEIAIDFDDRKELTSAREYTVFAEGSRRDSRDDVYDEALYKASAKTLREGFDWFRIVDSDIDRETVRSDGRASRIRGGFERTPVKRCGLLGCTTRYETNYRSEVETSFPERRDRVYEVTLDFVMGTGPVYEGGKVHFARNIKETRR